VLHRKTHTYLVDLEVNTVLNADRKMITSESSPFSLKSRASVVSSLGISRVPLLWTGSLTSRWERITMNLWYFLYSNNVCRVHFTRSGMLSSNIRITLTSRSSATCATKLTGTSLSRAHCLKLRGGILIRPTTNRVRDYCSSF
jgi:hypothetical protein